MINIPTLVELYNGIIADLEAEFGTSISPFGKNLLRALAAVQAAKLKIIYLRIGVLQKNIFADTADRENSGGTLERFGRIKLGRDPFPASQGQYAVTVTGISGATIPAQTTFKSDDNAENPGRVFVLDNAFTLSGTSGSIILRALEAGLNSQLNVGETLTATAPIINVSDAAVVTAESVAPQSEENIEEYRAKVLKAYRLEPQGGASADYRLWSYDAQGVKEAYPYAKSGVSNEINLFIEATVADSTDGHGTPGTAILDDVAAVIELDPDTTKPLSERGRRPLGVFAVNVLPVTPLAVDVEIADYQDLTPGKEALITAAITDLLATIRPFIGGADPIANKNDILSVNAIISEVVNAVPGSLFSSISMTVNGGLSINNYVFANGEIPYMSPVQFV